MNVCGTKPPPKLSSANSAERRRTIPRERCSGGSGSASSSSPRSTAGESGAAASPAAAAARGWAGQHGGEDGADGGVGETAAGEGNADQHRAEAVGERPRRLGGDDSARVGAQPRSS